MFLRSCPRAVFTALVFLFLFSASTVAVAQAPVAGQVLISEFRQRGPSGSFDEFIELYNNTDAALTVNDPTPPATGAAGWAVVTKEGVLFVVPNGTVIPARGHFLGVNKEPTLGTFYTLDAYPAGNTRTATGDINYSLPGIYDGGGIALFNTANPANFTLANRLDAVGFTTALPLFREGSGLRSLGLQNLEQSYYRDLVGGSPKDTGDNAADFVNVNTTGTFAGYLGRRLGAPGPENLSSPIRHDGVISSSLIDSCTGPGACRNLVRDTTPSPAQPNCSPLGTLAIRRRFTNNTGRSVTRLRFRVVDISTLGSPGSDGSQQADVRALTSAPSLVELSTGATVLVEGTTLEQPPVQPLCGGYNSSLSVDTIRLARPLLPGANVDVQFLLGVVKAGDFRFVVSVEALTDTP
jgi:hypothetical protein